MSEIADHTEWTRTYTGIRPLRREGRIILEAEMAKTDARTIDDWAKQRTVARREKNLVALLAVRGEIESGLDAGYTARTVWLYLYEQGRIPCKYGTFLKFVNRQIRQPPPAKVPVAPSKPTPVTPEVKKGPVFNPPEKLPGFYFNPIPCKEDLI